MALTNEGPPRFIDETGAPIVGTLGEVHLKPSKEESFTLPSIKDPDGNKYEIKVALGEALTFAKFDRDSFSFDFKATEK